MRVVSVAYLAIGPDLPDSMAGSDAADARWTPVSQALASERSLAFDHAGILSDGVERVRAKLEYTPLATSSCPQPFTVTELRQVYETVWDEPLDPRNFHRKVLSLEGFLNSTDSTTGRNGGRPAQLYVPGGASSSRPHCSGPQLSSANARGSSGDSGSPSSVPPALLRRGS